jgi:hypothetical protein
VRRAILLNALALPIEEFSGRRDSFIHDACENILSCTRRSLAMRPELIRATDLLRRNTPEAVEEAIGLLQNTVYSFSMKVCGHPEDAEDTMQEVLSRSLGHLGQDQTPQLWPSGFIPSPETAAGACAASRLTPRPTCSRSMS